MSTHHFPTLFQPLEIRGKRMKNRILSTGHDTVLPDQGVVNDALVAYHTERARGGAGLIVLQVSGVHETARYTSHMLMATDDNCIPGYQRVAAACHDFDCLLFGQLFHPGREIMETADGLGPVAYAPSAIPNERFHVMPRALDHALIHDIVAGYAAAASRMNRAGLDGVEIVASHGYLPSQFLNPHVNLRQDEYGTDETGRQQFLNEVVAAIRDQTDEEFIVGIRISLDEMDDDGLEQNIALKAVQNLESQLDYVNVTAGTSSSSRGSIHIAPPMTFENAYTAPLAARVKDKVALPVFVAGRINQPQEAEKIIASDQADGCGMTRAMICDPYMANKAHEGRIDDIRACIGCNQACIGRFHRGYPISCIQHPETGRELTYGHLKPSKAPKRILVAGGGPAGMKAAAVASDRGHDVTLYEAGRQLGGQALIAQLVPGRAEFGGIVTNLTRELENLGVRVERNTPVTRQLVEQEQPDLVIIATGAKPFWPEFDHDDDIQVTDAWQVLCNQVSTGSSALVTDWRADWIGIGVAEKLARDGVRVKLAVNGIHAGESLQSYVRDHSVARIKELGVDIIPDKRLYGSVGDTVFLQDIADGAAYSIEGLDSLVLCQGHHPVCELSNSLDGLVETRSIGDCLAPRTAEEAVFEGLEIAWQL
jgi:2,4-dienoyl-CoA reductase-like NADH-dependent reductase (Old Yellow Enzyme family)